MIIRLINLCLITLFLNPVLNAQQKVIDSSKISLDLNIDVWSFEIDAFYNILPNERNTTTLIGTADLDILHLESRYNYEADKTLSFFGGYNFETGNEIEFGLTPMLGFSAGNLTAIIPGLELSLSWKSLDYYSESEFVFDIKDNEDDFFYTWAELGITPVENFRTGLAATRTLLYQSDLDFQRGAFAGYTFRKLTAIVYYFNPFNADESYLIASIGIEF